jgi:hypothetical protein
MVLCSFTQINTFGVKVPAAKLKDSFLATKSEKIDITQNTFRPTIPAASSC